MEQNLDEIRRKKLAQLRRQAEQQQAEELLKQEQQRRQYEVIKRQIIRQILTPEARSRLGNIRAARPQYAEQIEVQLIQLAQRGQIKGKITDSQLKELLRKIQQKTKRDITIRRK